MKIAPMIGWIAIAMLCLSGHSASAGQVDKLVCKRLSGGPMPDFPMTIDFDDMNIVVPHDTGLQPGPGSVEITDNSVKWSFMRGFVQFDRRSRELDWDTRAEYDYLAAIGHAAREPESNFRGRMRCAASGAGG